MGVSGSDDGHCGVLTLNWLDLVLEQRKKKSLKKKNRGRETRERSREQINFTASGRLTQPVGIVS